MKTCKDNEFDLAICDPPYGIGKDGTIGFATEKTKGFTLLKKNTSKRIGIKQLHHRNTLMN